MARAPRPVTLAAALVVAGTLATEVPLMGKRWWLMTASARIRGNIRADAVRGVVSWPMAPLQRTPVGDFMARIVSDVEVLVDRRGTPLAVWLSAANVHDGTLLTALVDAIEPIHRPRPAGPAPLSARQAARGQGLQLTR